MSIIKVLVVTIYGSSGYAILTYHLSANMSVKSAGARTVTVRAFQVLGCHAE